MSAETDCTQAWFYENEAKRTHEDWKKKCAKIKRKKWWTIVLLPDAQTAPEIVQISLFTFPKDLALWGKWRKFCRRADKGFETQENPWMCAAHFKISDFKQSLNGRIDVRKGTSPSIFKVADCKENNSPRDRRSEKRKRPEHMEDCTYQPLKEARITQLKSAVAAEVVKHDHDYCSHKDFHDKSTQTNFDLPQKGRV